MKPQRADVSDCEETSRFFQDRHAGILFGVFLIMPVHTMNIHFFLTEEDIRENLFLRYR
jgi:hypothetical protein